MKINYNEWFYKFHQYLMGNRDGLDTYNDTNWRNVQERLQRLINIDSDILAQQPYQVVGNTYGFEQMLTLMNASGYTFEDINESLINTYEHSVRQSMSRMLVNTRAIVYHTKTMTKLYSKGKYYVVDIPFDQLRFGGERDEFIRQKFHDVHHTDDDNCLSLDEFTLSEYTKILKCAFIVSLNGMIWHDVKIGFDDHGLIFKIGYTGSYDPELIIYKLDDCLVARGVLTLGQITMYTDEDDGYISIPNIVLGERKQEIKLAAWKHCVMDIHPLGYPSVPTIPNFGSVTRDGRITIAHPQTKTFDQVKQAGTDKCEIIVYVPKFLQEINSIYPAANYMDLVRSSDVYTDKGNQIEGRFNRKIVTTGFIQEGYMEKCTPPICIDREYDTRFEDIINCCYCRNILMQYKDTAIRKLNFALNKATTYLSSYDSYRTNLQPDLQEMHSALRPYFRSYSIGSMLTGMFNEDALQKFTNFMNALFRFGHLREDQFENYRKFVVDEFYMLYYEKFVITVSAPFYDNKTFMNFRDLHDINKQFYEDTPTSHRYNRNVSEQCFITLKYSREQKSWLFAYPTIKHFHGIGNTFYIEDDLNGDEIFKFFVLYSDTENPYEKNVDDEFAEDVVLDYDRFMTEVEKHAGFIRYWHVENKLMKLSKLMFGKYDNETVVNLLSKILKRKLDAYELIDQYESQIAYATPNMTQYNIDSYNEHSEAAPFLLNFIFYTLRLLNNGKDLLQSYFYRTLTNRTYSPRYIDYNLSKYLETKHFDHANFTGATRASTVFSETESHYRTDQMYKFYDGLPFIFYNKTIAKSDVYYWIAQCIYSKDQDLNHYLIDTRKTSLDMRYWVKQTSSYANTGWYYIPNFARMITKFISCVRDHMSYILTNYKHAFDQSIEYLQAKSDINNALQELKTYYNGLELYMQSNLREEYNYIVNNFPYDDIMDNLYTTTQECVKSNSFYGGKNSKQKYVRQQANWFSTTIRTTYRSSGYYENTQYRVKGLYNHFKEINHKKNDYKYKKWLDQSMYDSKFLQLDLYHASTDYNMQILPEYNHTFARARNFLLATKEILEDKIPEYEMAFRTLRNTENNYLLQLEEYCVDAIRNHVHDLYAISEITGINFGASTAHELGYVVWTVTKDAHFINPNSTDTFGDTIDITFVPVVGQTGPHMWYLKDVRKPCEYLFFDGTPITGCQFRVYDTTGEYVRLLSDITVNFERVSSTACALDDVRLLPSATNTTVRFSNTHEDTLPTPGKVPANEKHTETNYELLVANHFMTLDKHNELVLNPKTMLQNSNDAITINNEKLNMLVLKDYSKTHKPQLLFKPSQIMHVDIGAVDKDATSIKGRLTPGQTIYISPTSHPEYVFPATVTSIDHSQAHGMMEAVVNERDAKWLQIDDFDEAETFLTSEIECTVLDDNLSNLLDEYNGNYKTFYNPNFNYNIEFSDEDLDGYLSVPGDPIFVQNNAEYIYTRLHALFPEDVKNRFIDDEHKKWNFKYLGYDKIVNHTSFHDQIDVTCINHNWTTLTLSEQYPILRDEPNDHYVWREERRVFQDLIDTKYVPLLNQYQGLYQQALDERAKADTNYDRDIYSRKIENYLLKQKETRETIYRLQSYIDEQEHPTTWYNVDSYDAAMGYIDNGRAQQVTSTYQPSIKDIPYTQIFLYDWEHKEWIDPSLYAIYVSIDPHYKYDNDYDFTAPETLRFLVIMKKNGFPDSNMVLIYMGYYNKSYFNIIADHSPLCKVRFKPLLTIDQSKQHEDDLYKYIYIRKHIDSGESYSMLNNDIKPYKTFEDDCIYINRNNHHSGRLPYTPIVRYKDIVVKQNNSTYDYTKFKLFVKNPFVGSMSNVGLPQQTFEATINQPINDFKPNETITLICLQNTIPDSRRFNGNISNVTFVGKTNTDGTITITKTSLSNNVGGSYITTVVHNHRYSCNGGLVTINITTSSVDIMNSTKQWIQITDPHHILPSDEFILQPTIQFAQSGIITVDFDTTYNRSIVDTMKSDNSNVNNPYEYYYNTSTKYRYPISTMRDNNTVHTRLTIDQSINPNIKLIKSNHVHVCRYFASRIPADGFIDVTGYIPTPLSRTRYEFWVNGRQIKDTEHLIILSPSSFQLIGLTSLKNFELIELVDDFGDTLLMNTSTVYVANDGSVYANYEEALQHMIISQNIQYTFNMYPYQHTTLQNYSKMFVPNPNNQDLEDDILDTILSNEATSTNYNDFNHVPTINDMKLYHPTSDDIGLSEMPIEEMVHIYDHAYRYEILTDPTFPMTHKDDTFIPINEYIRIHYTKNKDGEFDVFLTGSYKKYVMLYLSDSIAGDISNINKTKFIIPCIRTGVRIHIPETCRRLYVHVTFNNYEPIQLL